MLTACATETDRGPFTADAQNTDTFPTFTANPSGARAQLDDGEAAAKIADLEQASAEADAAAQPAISEIERLRRLRRLHEQRALRRIEGR